MTHVLPLDKNKDDFSNSQPFCNHEVGIAEDDVLKITPTQGGGQRQGCVFFNVAKLVFHDLVVSHLFQPHLQALPCCAL